MAKPLRIILVFVGLTLLTALAAAVLGNTNFSLTQTTGEAGELSIETSFPNASCKKVLSKDFPYVHFECQEHQEDGLGQTPTDSEPKSTQP